MQSRKEEQADLLIQFGELVAPLEELVEYADQQTAQTCSKASAKFTHDCNKFQNSLGEFIRGEPGHDYHVEHRIISKHLSFFKNNLSDFREDTNQLRNALAHLRRIVKQHILAIPCELDSEVLEAASPFTAYVKLRSICETSNQLLVFVDPYMGPNVVRRYFHRVPEHVSIRVVTKKRSGQEFKDFLDLSKIVADERGQSKYCLMYHSTLHDRYLQCDDYVYHLGGSLKDAGRKSGYTITKIMDVSDGANAVQNLVSESVEQFGASNSNHPLP